jgi:F-type H+-transporting ATPase subunit epsilon
MLVEIYSPDKQLFEGEATSVMLPGADGSFGVLNNHAPIISALKKGQVKLHTTAEGDKSFDIKGGVVEVLNNKMIILAE